MPSANFLAAAAADNRKPVILMAVESIDAIKKECSTKADWNASKSLTNINTTTPNPYFREELGVAFLVTDGDEKYSGDYTPDPAVVNLSTPGYIATPVETAAFSSPNNRTIGTIINAMVKTVWVTEDFELTYNCDTSIKIQGSLNGGAYTDLFATTVTYSGSEVINGGSGYTYKNISIPIIGLTKGSWQFKLVITGVDIVGLLGPVGGLSRRTSATIIDHAETYKTLYLGTGSLQSRNIDLGLVPITPSRFEVDDISPVGCTIAYFARGSNDGSTWTDLGTVADGDALAAFRYYDFTAALTGNGIETPVLQEIRVIGGDSQYDYYSNHKDQPIQGAKPYIKEKGISSLTSKIDLLKPATTGEVTAKLFWRKKTGDMITTGYLKNKAVQCKLGFVGLAEADFEPYFTGTWYDYSADANASEINVKTRDVWKRFKQKIPEETVDASGNKTTVPLVLSGNIIQQMLQIIDLIGAPDRYIDRATFVALRDGARAGADWDVSRTITEPTAAEDLMNELAVSAGAFLYPLPNGKMTIRLFDDVIAVTPDKDHTFDANRITFKAIEGGQGKLTTRHKIYYQLIPGKKGTSNEDYAKCYININAAAEIAWGEVQETEWLDKWGLSANHAVQKLAQRLDSFFATPKFTVKADNVPPRYMGLNPGEVVAVDNLELPTTADNWEAGLRYTDAKKFLIISKSINPNDLTLSFELFEVGPTTYQLQTLPAYPAYALFPAVLNFTVTEKIIQRQSGVMEDVFRCSFTEPTDFRYGGARLYSKISGGNWVFAGEVQFGAPNAARVFDIPVKPGGGYQIMITTVNAAGLEQPFVSAIVVSKTASGINQGAVAEVIDDPFGNTLPGVTVPSVTLPAVPTNGELSFLAKLQLPAQQTPSLLDKLTGSITEDQLYLDLITPIRGPLTFAPGVVEPGVQVEKISDLLPIESRLSQARIQVDDAQYKITLQTSRVDVLTGRMTSAEVAIDGAEATITLHAASINDLTNRMSTAEIDIDAANAAITLRATQASLDTTNQTVTTQGTELGVLKDRITFKLNSNGHVAGMVMGWQQPDSSEVVFVTNTFKIVNPDNAVDKKQIFTVGTINGSSTVGINGNLFVDGTIVTRHLEDNSISNPIAAYTDTVARSSGPEITVQSAQITSTGKKILILASFCYHPDLGSNFSVGILRGSTEIYRTGLINNPSSNSQNFSCQVIDEPVAGSYIYTLKMYFDVNWGSKVSQRSLVLIELKK